MLQAFAQLPFVTLRENVDYAQPTQTIPVHVTLDSPALDVMCDFTRVAPITIQSRATVYEAQLCMMEHDVHLLLVVDQNHKVSGVVTASDVLGEHPVQIAVEQAMRRDDIMVRAIMTPSSGLQVVSMEQVRIARVGHIVATLQHAARDHALVIDRGTCGMRVRSTFSAAEICRQLQVPCPAPVIARTFAEIEAQFMH